MEYTHVGRLGLVVSRLCLGTMNFGPHAPEDESHTIMDTAVSYGINLFDTANVYGRHLGVGATEKIIGRWFEKGSGRRDKVVLATKVYGQMGDWPNEGRLSKLGIIRQCEASLERLRTDRIASLPDASHRPERLVGRDLGSDGPPQASGEDPARRILQLRWVAHREGERDRRLSWLAPAGHRAVGLQPQRAIARARGDPGRARVRDGVDQLQPARGWPARGSAREGDGRPTFPGVHGGRDQQTRARLERWEALCRDLGQRPADVALAWLLHQPVVTAPIIGPRTEEQLLGSMKALDITLDDDVLARLDQIFPGPGGPAPEAYAW